MADDAGALLVRSGLVSSNALDDARARVANVGGTLGEQLVTSGVITDDALTDFYRSRLLVPQVNPNMLARLTPKVVGMLPGDMAIELRAIPVALDGDNNLTVAMSDPSDRHAVDEIAFFTGAYVVRAVATQMQIAWCLAHYYGHVTALGQRLLHSSERDAPSKAVASSAAPPQRTKGLTGKVNATRHRAVAPITGPVNVARPTSSQLDLRPLAGAGGPADASHVAGDGGTPAAMPAGTPRSAPIADTRAARAGGERSLSGIIPAQTIPHAGAPMPPPLPPRTQTPQRPSATPPGLSGGPGLRAGDAAAPSAPLAPASGPLAVAPSASPPSSERSGPPISPTASAAVPRAAPDATTLPPLDGAADPIGSPPEIAGEITRADEGAPDKPRARSVSGEIRVPATRRAPSIRPPLPRPDDEDDDDEPLIVIEAASDDDTTGPRMMPPRRRAVKSDPPELYARAGEVDLKSTSDRTIEDEPRIVVDEDALAPPTARIDTREIPGDDLPLTTIDVVDDADTGALIHDRVIDRESDQESKPILLDRPRATPDPLRGGGATPGRGGERDDDTGETAVVVLEAKRRPRADRRTQVGVPPAPVPVRPQRDTEASAIPKLVDGASERSGDDDDPTMLDLHAAPPDETTSDQLAAPPGPASEYDTNPYVIAPPPAPERLSAIQPALIIDGAGAGADDDDDVDLDDGDEPRGPSTSEMTAAELDDAIPERTTEFDLGRLSRHRIDHDPVDDGWGPPGTTIPPPLLGAIPGSEDDDEAISTIPMPNVDSSPLMVGPPTVPPASDPGGQALVRALEDATARAIEVIRELEHAQSRDDVVHMLVAYLAETHHRAGFFVTRHGASKGTTELGMFTMTPKPAVMPFATLRLDRPSTLQDVVGTRLPYRGPMHDDTSRGFLVSVLGACPAEILLVPVAVRERVVGVLFGEHRRRHTFDDQLALAARAAGMALERILRAKRA